MSPVTRQELGIKTPEERAAQAEAIAEKEIQGLCEQELNRRNIVYLHLSPRAREKVGWPDLVFALNGIPVAVELKTATGTLSKEQAELLQRMHLNGWETHVIRSFDSFQTLLKKEVKHA